MATDPASVAPDAPRRARIGRTLVIRLNEPPLPPKPPAAADKALEWLKVLAAPLATVLVTGLLGSYVSTWLSDKEARETNERLYAQLLIQREQSDTLIRKDMFGVVINRFLTAPDKPQDWGDKVLQLELLANNFSQSLDLAPLFKDIGRRLPSACDVQPSRRDQLLQRIDQTASTLNFKQITSLARRGFTHPKKIKPGLWERAGAPMMIKATVPMLQLTPSTREISWTAQDRATFTVEVVRADLDRRELEVRLVMRRSRVEEPLFDQHFWIGRYDFPMLSNVQLPYGLRAAVAITAFDVPEKAEDREAESFAQLHLVVFPSSSASFKERQDYDDILLDMVRQRQGPAAQKEAQP